MIHIRFRLIPDRTLCGLKNVPESQMVDYANRSKATCQDCLRRYNVGAKRLRESLTH